MYYKADWKKYLIVFLITAGIFTTAFTVSNRLNGEKVQELQQMQDRLSIDILSSEVQFALLAESSCETVNRNSALSKELDTLGSKLSYMEDQAYANEDELKWLKKNYALLEIKDYLLMKELSAKCDAEPIFILYFYSNEKGECTDCKRQGIVLTSLRQDYPGLRVYSFDYNLDLSALKTLSGMYDISSDTLPALVIDKKVYYGFQSAEDIEKILPDIESLKDQEDETTIEAGDEVGADENVDGADGDTTAE